VLEAGKRHETKDFPKTNWKIWKFLWMPKLLLHGIQKITLLKDVLILGGAGVGGGSLVYANTSLVPPDKVFTDPRWPAHPSQQTWKDALAPFYALAQRMLGVTKTPQVFSADKVLKSYAEDIGRADTFHSANVAVYFGEANKTVPDPFFSGEGPDRTGCNYCGGCMVGCRFGAKNTLDKNYLWLAEKRGCVIEPETQVTAIEALPNGGYRVHTERSTAFVFKHRRVFETKGVVIAAGVLGTVKLLLDCKRRGLLPKLSERLGEFVRTNSEALVGARAKGDVDYSTGIAIASGVYVDDHTHIEVVRYPKRSDAMAVLSTLLTDNGTRLTRPLRFLVNIVRHPLQFLRTLIPFGWAQKTIILLVMQSIDNHMQLLLRRPWYWPFRRTLTTARGNSPPVPVYIEPANEAAKAIAKKIGGMPLSSINEVMLNVATTAHILGGCPMGSSAQDGVIDYRHRAFGYDDFYVVDGSTIPVNLGVNPSLTITALAEHAMSHVENKPGATLPAPVKLSA
jgi:cholesterol oxidase